MFSKIKLASGLLSVLAAFCLLQLVTGGIGFWFLTSTHHGDAMKKVSTSISRVAQMMAEISASSLEQSTGIEQVNQAVVQRDSMAQQNAALVEEAAAAASSLHDQTRQLKEAVSVFEISPAVLGDARFAAAAHAAVSEPMLAY